jgi:cell division protein FtsQ
VIGAVVVVLVLAALVWVTVFSPVLDVRAVRVVGATPEEVAPVERAAAVGPGTSLLWLDGDAVADRVRTEPRVASVDVGRRWPRTLVITVTEREPVLAVPHEGGVVLVDATGFAYRTAPARPPGVPTFVLPGGVLPSPEEPGTRAAADVIVALPATLRADIAEVRGGGAYDVGFVLTDGRQVRWGGDVDNERKAAVLAALLTRPGALYDVSTPQLAVVR